jgi:hypothetical protein
MNKKTIFWIIAIMIILSTASIAQALTQQEKDDLTNLYKEYNADNAKFKQDAAKSTKMKTLIIKNLAERYSMEIGTATDVARLEEMKRKAKYFQLPAEIISSIEAREKVVGTMPTPAAGESALDSSGKITYIGTQDHIKDIKQVKEKNQDKIWIKYSSLPSLFATNRLIGTEYYKINPLGKWIALEKGKAGEDTSEYYYISGTRNLRLRATAKAGDYISLPDPSGAINIDDTSIRTKTQVPVTPGGGETTPPITPTGKLTENDCVKELNKLREEQLNRIALNRDKESKKKNALELIDKLKQLKAQCKDVSKKVSNDIDKKVSELSKYTK